MKQLANPTVLFVRHGEVKDNKNDVLPGWRNDAIDENGKKEAEATAAKLEDYPIRHIYTSDLSRADATARIIADKTGAAITPTSALRPWNYGSIAGQPNDKENQSKLLALQSSPDQPAPSGESFNDYTRDRFYPAVAKLRDYAIAHPEAAVVAVTHSRNLLALKHALGDQSQPVGVDKSSIPNASIWKAEFNDKFPNGFRVSEV